MGSEKIKIKDLPSKDAILSSDILVESDKENTYKITMNDVVSYASESDIFKNTYILNEVINNPNGVVGLDLNSKIDGTFVSYGDTKNTAYEGSSGKILEQNIDNHLLDSDAHGYSTKIQEAYNNAKKYVDDSITNLIGGASSTADTLGEIEKAMKESSDVVEALDKAIGTKANQADLTTHVQDNDIHVTTINKTNWDDAYSKSHQHSNISVLEGITATIVNSWNTAVNHISDTIKHITSDERTLWNTVSDKASLSHTHTKTDITDFPSSMPASDVYSWAKEKDKPNYTLEELGLGNVDNTSDADKSVKYAETAGSATNADNATTVNSHTVLSDVPANAKFTDTTYSSKAAVSGGTDVSLVTTGEKATWNAKTSNTGTLTGIIMNGSSKGTSGVVDLGTVLTGGSQTSTSTADGGSNVYTFSDGSTITVKNGSKGSQGNSGTNGTSVTVTSVSESSADGGSNVVTFSDGKTVTIKNGSKGSTGATGSAGEKGEKGEKGDAGTTPTIKAAAGASIGAVGTPSVTASTSGTTTTFTFNNLKGEKGEKGDTGTNATTTAVATTSSNGLMSGTDKSKLDGIASGANAYTHPTTSGNKHIPSGGSSGQILRWSADGTAVWGSGSTGQIISTTEPTTQSAGDHWLKEY